MNRIALITALAMITLTACDKAPSAPAPVPEPVTSSSPTLPPGHPPVDANEQPLASTLASKSELTERATVISVIDIPEFSYIEVAQDKKTRWLVAKTIPAKKGDIILFDEGSIMHNFNSKALQRTFSSVTFVNTASISKGK